MVIASGCGRNVGSQEDTVKVYKISLDRRSKFKKFVYNLLNLQMKVLRKKVRDRRELGGHLPH